MADIQIDAAAQSETYRLANRGGPFWTAPLVGYVIYSDSAGKDLKYRKTGDGGATWAAGVDIKVGAIYQFDCIADWQIVGDAGTKIHIVYIDQTTSDIRYIYLDTSIDGVGGDDQIEACQGTGTFVNNTWRFNKFASITKTRGGNLAVAIHYRDTNNTDFWSFYTSPDATTWTSENSPWEADAEDYCYLFTGNEADNQDIWAIYWDKSATAISLKTYDDSLNNWGEQAIAGGFTPDTLNYAQCDGCIRLSDGHLIFGIWTDYDDAAADLKVYDINGAGSIVAKANVITNTAEYFLVSVFINQVNDDIYIVYVGGTAAGSLVQVRYQLSSDGGATWDGDTVFQADVEDDERWVSTGAAKVAWGGRFQPFWFNEDPRDLFTNTDNGIAIPAAGGGGIEDKSANMGSKLIAGGLI